MTASKKRKSARKKRRSSLPTGPLPAGMYRYYIRSARWFRRRKKWLDTYGSTCKVCNTTQRIQLHHKTYERLGVEQDSDLVSLCKTHHDAIHALQKATGGSLAEVTDSYIATADYAVQELFEVPIQPKPPRKRTKRKVVKKRA